ncbi:MAG TPA: AAA family ATPase [Nakamurella sp.]
MLVGRERERQRIEALIAGARLGSSGVLVVTGEPGIGKTTLLTDIADSLTGMTVLRATGTEAERDLPFAGLGQLLRPSAADLAAIPEPQAAAIGVALALRPGPPGDRFAVGAAVLSLLIRWSEEHPLALVVDDAHLLDRPSAESLLFAARRLLADPVLVLVGVRSGEASVFLDADLPDLTLGGLDEPAATELATRSAGRPLGTRTLSVLLSVAGGNPLAVRELARDPAGLRNLDAAPPGSPLPAPSALTERYATRVARLPDRTRVALLIAATTGDDLTVITRACAAMNTDVTALDAAEQAGLVVMAWDGVSFTHPLVRSAVYASASPEARRVTHAAVVGALPGGDVDRRAWHRCDAAVGPDPDVAAEIERVGERATARGAHAVAATAFERAAHLTPAEAERSRLFVRAGAAAWQAGQPGRAQALLDSVEPMVAGQRVVAQVLALRGTIAARQGDLQVAQDLLTDAAHAVEGLDPDEAIGLHGDAVVADFFLADAVAARRSGSAIRRLMGGPVAEWARAVGSMSIGMAQVLAGEPGIAAIRSGVGMLAEGDQQDLRVPARWRTVGALWLREAHTGRRLLAEAVEDRRALADLGELPSLLFYRAVDHAATGRWERAAADYTEAIALAREFDQITLLAMSLAGLARVQARSGRSAECRTHADEALAICAARTIRMGLSWSRLAIGDLELSLGRAEAAAAEYALVDEWLTVTGIADVDLAPGPDRVEALLRLGHDRAARAVTADYGLRAERKGQPWARARADRAAGLVGPDDELDHWFPAALRWHAQTPDRFETARTQLSYGSRLRRARRRVEARPPIRAALDTFEELGAGTWAERAAEELTATGATARRRATRDVDLLTPRELQIALLLAEGRTTRETAAALFMSPKTVEYHLRHVYTKLGIDSRRALADRLGDPGSARTDGRDLRDGRGSSSRPGAGPGQ